MTKALLIGLVLALFALPAAAREAPAIHARHNPPEPVATGPLGEPGVEEAALAAWAAGAVAMTMTFSHINSESAMKTAKTRFTKDGWEGFTKAMENSHIIDSVIVNAQTVSAIIATTPVVTKKGTEGFLDKRYRWTLQMPMTLKYEGKQTHTDELQLDIVVERAPTEENPAGLGIAQWLARVK